MSLIFKHLKYFQTTEDVIYVRSKNCFVDISTIKTVTVDLVLEVYFIQYNCSLFSNVEIILYYETSICGEVFI